MIRKNIFSILVALIILYLSLAPSNNFEDVPVIDIPNIDKIAHFLMYLTFMSVIIFENRKKIKYVSQLIYIGIIPFVYGISMEILQMLFTTTRNGSLFDILFNFLGILFSALLWLWIKPQRKQLIK
jgi:VanZ family protein